MTMKVWMLLREGDFTHPWFPVSLHTTREAAVAAIPAGSEHHPAGPDAEWDPLEKEQWTAPRDGRYWYGCSLRIEEWEATP